MSWWSFTAGIVGAFVSSAVLVLLLAWLDRPGRGLSESEAQVFLMSMHRKGEDD